jgi:hypothetical protein
MHPSKHLTMLALGGILLFSACTDRTERSLKSQTRPVAPPPAMNAPAANAAVDTTAINAPAPGASGTVALNPEHGMPGHRCEIPVGAPLNSPAAAQPQVSVQQSTQQPAGTRIEQPLTTPNTSKTVRLNPAHGEPGHDCNIPVGEPLKN